VRCVVLSKAFQTRYKVSSCDMPFTSYARAKTRAREHCVIFDLARFPHLWADLSHFLHVGITFDALQVGVVVLRFYQVVN